MGLFNPNKFLLFHMLILSISACSNIEPMGAVGKNQVYVITKNSFMSSSQMLVLLNKKGEVAAFSGGTVPGAGVIAQQTITSLATAGAVMFAGRAVEQGLENAKVRGIPSKVELNGNVSSSHRIELIHQ